MNFQISFPVVYLLHAIMKGQWVSLEHLQLQTEKCLIFYINLLTPNVNYSGRTAPLTSKVAFYIFIQQI